MTAAQGGLRLVLIAIAISGVTYAAARAPAELAADPIISLSERIVGGYDFDPKALDLFEPFMAAAERDTRCGPTRGPLAAIRAYQVQLAAMAGNGDKALANGELAIRNIKQKLACSPEDGLSWFTLFLMQSSLSGRARANLPFLLMSYKVAPNEGQLARTRSQVATALYPLVGPELQGYIRAEFQHIARDDFTTTVSLLLGSGEPLQRILLPMLEAVPLEQRKLIALRLAAEGSEIVIPGIPRQ